MWFLLGFLTAGFLVETVVLVWVLVKRGLPHPGEHDEDRERHTMDEGFENIMSFSVRGHDGFGGDG